MHIRIRRTDWPSFAFYVGRNDEMDLPATIALTWGFIQNCKPWVVHWRHGLILSWAWLPRIHWAYDTRQQLVEISSSTWTGRQHRIAGWDWYAYRSFW